MKLKKDFLSIADLSASQLMAVLRLAAKLKAGKASATRIGKTLIMIFEKPSLRTHVSFEVAMTQLGGHAVYLGSDQIGLGKRESIEHAAKVLSRMGDLIMARVFLHETLVKLAKYSSVPVINGLSDLEHPCQILADMMTIFEQKGRWKGLKLAYIGDCKNNVARSLALVSDVLGIHFVAAGPEGYTMNSQTHDPKEAVKNADVVYTDTWISMGYESQKAKRLKVFPPYQVNAKLMKLAKSDAIFMHDMPAHIGREVTKDVFDGPQSVVYDQAENRLHAQKALLVFLS